MSAPEPSTLLVIQPSSAAPRNSEGAILPLADGRLLLVYTRFTGGGWDHAAADIACRESQDGGLTWSSDRLLVENEGRENVMSVSLLRLPSGEVLLFYLVKNGCGDCRSFVRRSQDELITLSKPVCATPEAGFFVVNNDRVVRHSSGRLIVPAAYHACPGGSYEHYDMRGVSTCFLSDDTGRTWRRCGSSLAAPEITGSGLQEPGIVERLDGSLLMWMRTTAGCQYQSVSQDGGETWSPPAPGPLISPLSPASIKRTPWGGAWLAVWNDHSDNHPFPPGRRTPLCAAISSDEGQTWSESRVIEGNPDGWYCYTSLTFTPDSVLLSYCAGDSIVGGLNRLKVTQIHRAWLGL